MRLLSSRTHLALSLVLGAALLGACGGSADTAPTPLANHMDDMFIASIALDQKQAVVQTQNDWSVAKLENAKAESDYQEMAGSKLAVAKNDHQSAKLQVSSAISNKKSAEASADNTRINAAQVELHNAELGEKAAAAHVKYFVAYRDYLKANLRFTQENMYWRESQYELAKVQLAQKNNISPKGINLAVYPGQEQSRNQRAQKAKAKADTMKQRAAASRDAWLQQQTASDQASGRSSQAADPMSGAH